MLQRVLGKYQRMYRQENIKLHLTTPVIAIQHSTHSY